MRTLLASAVIPLLAATGLVAILGDRVVADSYLIPAPNRADMVYDSARRLVYITSGSEVLRFNLDTKQFLAPFRLGGSLAGIDISSDGNWLAVADTTYTPTSEYFRPIIWFHLIDLNTAVAERVFLPIATWREAGTFSVAFGADGLVYSSTRYEGSGWGYLRTYDPRSREVKRVTDSVSEETVLSTTADRTVVAFAERFSNGSWGAIRVTDGRILRRDSYQAGTGAYNTSIAINRTASQVAIPTSSGLFTFDAATLARTQRFTGRYPVNIVGAAYHPTRDILYISVSGYHDIRAFDSNTFVEVARYTLPEPFQPVWYSPYEGGRLKISPDGRLLFAAVTGGVRYITLDTRVIEESDTTIAYSGRWDLLPCAGCSGGALKWSAEPMARAHVSFVGSGIKWVAATTTLAGKANVYVDGVFRTTIDLYSPATTFQVPYEISGLTAERHVVTIEVTGVKNPSAIGTAVPIDAFEVIP